MYIRGKGGEGKERLVSEGWDGMGMLRNDSNGLIWSAISPNIEYRILGF